MATEADDLARELGRLIETQTPFSDVPYGLVTKFLHEDGEETWLYTSEHTDADAVAGMWQYVPDHARLISSIPCPRAYEFRTVASSVTVHQLISKREENPVDRITPEKFFTAQILGRLR